MRSTLTIFFAILALSFLPTGRSEALMVELRLEDLIKDAEVIVKGEVKKTKSVVSLAGGFNINTRTILTVDQALKGEAKKVLKIEHEGGEIWPFALWVEDTPEFKKGESVVVFLNKKDSVLSWLPWRKNIYEVTGLIQGKFLACEDNKLIRFLNCEEFENTADGDVYSLEELEKKIKEVN